MFGLRIDIVLSVLRHLLTTFGGVLVSSGWISGQNLELASGAIIAVVGLIFAAVHHQLANGSAVPENIATVHVTEIEVAKDAA